VSLVMTFTQGVDVERLSGISTGHAELLRWFDAWLLALEGKRKVGDGDTG
jgi:hypothetical protein